MLQGYDDQNGFVLMTLHDDFPQTLSETVTYYDILE